MLSPEQEEQLVQYGDCPLHFHSSDRRPSQDFIHDSQRILRQDTVTADTTLTERQDHILVGVTITLPRCFGGREFEITKIVAANTIYVEPTIGDTIVGSATGASIVMRWTSIRFKATDTKNWIVI